MYSAYQMYVQLVACDYPTLSVCKVHEHVLAQINVDEDLMCVRINVCDFISILSCTFAHSKDATLPH